MVGAPFEDTIAAMQLITSGHLQRYPAVKIICSHLGGALPMITRRADDHVPWEAPDTPEPPSQAAHRLWYDTVSHCHEPALRCAIELRRRPHPAGHRFPYEDGDTFVRAVEYVMDVADPGEAHAILDANAMALSASLSGQRHVLGEHVLQRLQVARLRGAREGPNNRFCSAPVAARGVRRPGVCARG